MVEFHNTSLAEQVFLKLENDIVQGLYPIGEVITELKLADQLGVSRTPIREALRRLEQEGLIRDIGKGSVVLGITEENLLDIMDIRILIEPLASYYAAQNCTPEGIKELRDILDLQEFYASKHDIEHLREEDEVFHDAICRLSGRSVISETLLPLHRKTRRYRRISIENDARRAEILNEHHSICEAIASGNADLAAELTSNHVKQAKQNMIARLNKNG